MSKNKKVRLVADPGREKAHCLRNAQQFLDASARCARHEAAEGGLPMSLQVPAVVNAAFAVELAFKALLLGQLKKNDPAPEGHELLDLFSKLTPADQASLRKAVAVPIYPRLAQPSNDALLDALAEHAKAFVAWRYVHEGVGGDLLANLAFLASLATAAIALA
jgi:hypothetical protein